MFPFTRAKLLAADKMGRKTEFKI